MTTEKRSRKARAQADHPAPAPAPGRAYAVAGLMLGGSASVAANVANAIYVQPTLNLVSVLSALFWPGATLIGFELIVRPSWPTKGWQSVPWWVMRLAVVGVGVVAVVGSYEHMHSLLGHFREDPFVARTGPAAIDGLMVTSAAALLVIERYGAGSPRQVAPGRVVTLTARPAPAVAWVAPARALPAPLDSIGATLAAMDGLRGVAPAAAPAPPRATARVLAPPKSPRPPTRPAPGDQGEGRPAPEWTTRSALGPGPHPGRPRGDLLADLQASLRPGDPRPSAVQIAAHYRIKNEAARSLRDALTQPAQAGGAEGEIN